MHDFRNAAFGEQRTHKAVPDKNISIHFTEPPHHTYTPYSESGIFSGFRKLGRSSVGCGGAGEGCRGWDADRPD